MALAVALHYRPKCTSHRAAERSRRLTEIQQGQPHIGIDRPFRLDASSNSTLTSRLLAGKKASRAVPGRLTFVSSR